MLPDEMFSLLRKLVETESPSHDKAAVDRVGALVAEAARRLGAEVETVPNSETGDHVIARFYASNTAGRVGGGSRIALHPTRPAPPYRDQGEGDKEGILLLCHMDTVFPLGALAKMPWREADGKLYGPGVLDMKSGIVISLAAASAAGAGEGPARPVTLLCTSDEETGSHTSRALIEELAKQSALVLVLEAALPDGSLKTWRKGVGEFTVRVRGRAAHAGGAHAEGRNAIEEMAHQVIAIQQMTDYARQTTLNVGVLRGGTVSNVVPEEAVAEVDVRVMQPGEWERVEAAMKSLKPVLEGVSLEISGVLNRPPMPEDATMKATFARAREIAAGIGMALTSGGTGGGSDANFVAPLGVPVLDGLGAVGEGYHSEREYIVKDSLPERVELLAAILRNW
ncbi:MAG: M20 family metallopeptidase [Chloroflexota bacterium]